MAEALALLGGIAAGFTLVKELSALSRKFSGTCKSLRYARQESTAVVEESRLLSSILYEFLRVIETDFKHIHLRRVRDAKKRIAKTLVSHVNAVLCDFRRMLRAVRALRPGSKASLSAKLVAHMKWLLGRDSLRAIRLSLSATRGTMILFVSLQLLEE
jgi:hypothetical protein